MTWYQPTIESQQRWGQTQAYLLLRDHESAYKALCRALHEGATVGEAIMAIEAALAEMPELPAEARKRMEKGSLKVGERFLLQKPSEEEIRAMSADVKSKMARLDKVVDEIDVDIVKLKANSGLIEYKA